MTVSGATVGSSGTVTLLAVLPVPPSATAGAPTRSSGPSKWNSRPRMASVVPSADTVVPGSAAARVTSHSPTLALLRIEAAEPGPARFIPASATRISLEFRCSVVRRLLPRADASSFVGELRGVTFALGFGAVGMSAPEFCGRRALHRGEPPPPLALLGPRGERDGGPWRRPRLAPAPGCRLLTLLLPRGARARGGMAVALVRVGANRDLKSAGGGGRPREIENIAPPGHGTCIAARALADRTTVHPPQLDTHFRDTRSHWTRGPPAHPPRPRHHTRHTRAVPVTAP